HHLIFLPLRPLRNLPLRSLRLNLYTFKKLEHQVLVSTNFNFFNNIPLSPLSPYLLFLHHLNAYPLERG
ncbi:MAG: hypothetical protein AB1414_21090, partial [bacterium]